MDILNRFIEFIWEKNLFTTGDKLLLAVSGGSDSVVLCELCRQAGFDFAIAHCNFQLRGTESDADEKFVEDLARHYAVPIFIKRFDTEKYAGQNGLSIQESARNLRYAWFDELIHTEKKADWLLTAHHADDSIETMLMNFFRGTGLQGLTGIPARHKKIRRPLLHFFKKELLEFATRNQLSFREDSSNTSTKYTRNYFRLDIIPAIEKVFPAVNENLQDNLLRFQSIAELYQLSVNKLKEKLIHKKGNEIHIPIKLLLGYRNRAIVYEIIRDYDFTESFVDELIRLSESESGKYLISPGNHWRIIKHRHWFIISPVTATESNSIIIEKGNDGVEFAAGNLELEIADAKKLNLETDKHVALIDLDEIDYPLLLRPWKTGDYFYPLGMSKKKKLARFFIDNKLSKTEKERTWVIESQHRIVWVVGQRIDNRFRVTDQTKKILKISFSPVQT